VRFAKYQALGNDYVVLEESEWPDLDDKTVRRVCDRHFGVGSDGILLRSRDAGVHRVRIFNPDGSEAEKSGNGLRIFARYLFDHEVVTGEPFKVSTPGGEVTCVVCDGGRSVSVDMGRASFDSAEIPVAGPRREVLRETLEVGGVVVELSAVTIGNPHCVILREHALADDARGFGQAIEIDPRFPNRTNVQFLEVMDRENLRIEIWERGAGYTLASGSSACGAAAVARKLGLCEPAVTVHMPGGAIDVEIDDQFLVRQCGPVVRVADGALSPEFLEAP